MMMIDNFVDPDNDGLSGANPNPVVTTPTGGLITGVNGGFGCTLGFGRGGFDPLFPGMLLLALGSFFTRKTRAYGKK